MHSFISNFLWYIFNLGVEHSWRFVIDQQERIGSTNFSTAFRLRNIHFFSFWSSLILIFSLSVSIVFFRRIFRFSPQSHSLSPTPAPAPACSRQEGTIICFAPDHSFDYSRVFGLRKKYGLFFGLKDFALIDVLVSWKL